jgi:hypothetical protein
MATHSTGTGVVKTRDALYCPVPKELENANPLAVRRESLAGLRIGFLGNLKPNCDILLHSSEEQVIRLGAAETLYREKESCSLGAPESILDEIAATCQAAVVALGD